MEYSLRCLKKIGMKGSTLAMVALTSALAVGGAGSSALAAPLDIASTFEGGGEGWTITGGALSHVREPENGYLVATDNRSDNMIVSAPDRFLGDLSAFEGGQLSFEAKLIDVTRDGNLVPNPIPWEDFGKVTLIGNANPEDPGNSEVATVDLAELGVTGILSSEWTTFQISLTPEAWGFDPQFPIFSNLLKHIVGIRINLESTFDIDRVAFDNFRLRNSESVPEPGTLVLVAAGVVGGLSRRRRV